MFIGLFLVLAGGVVEIRHAYKAWFPKLIFPLSAFQPIAARIMRVVVAIFAARAAKLLVWMPLDWAVAPRACFVWSRRDSTVKPFRGFPCVPCGGSTDGVVLFAEDALIYRGKRIARITCPRFKLLTALIYQIMAFHQNGIPFSSNGIEACG